MAEILIVRNNRVNPGTLDPAGLWKDGDVVVVNDDGYVWGREELNPDKFEIIKRPGVSVLALKDSLLGKRDLRRVTHLDGDEDYELRSRSLYRYDRTRHLFENKRKSDDRI